jgi:DNA-binding transcriptional MocR family regulator
MPHQPAADGTFRYRSIENHVMEMISSETLKPGDRIPSLREMSAKMRVGIQTVSHAYAELERKGVVEARERSGFFVSSGFRRLPSPSVPNSPPPAPLEGKRSQLVQEILESKFSPNQPPLGTGGSDEDLLPTEQLNRVMRSVLREDPAGAVTYGSLAGNAELRKQIAVRSMDAGLSVSPDEIVVTSGALSAVSILTNCLTRPGDIVLIQSPGYFCYHQMIDAMGLRVIEIPSCPEDGVQPDEVARAVTDYDVSMALFNFNYATPDGSLTSDEAKREIVRTLARRNLPLVEDDVSGDLYFGEERPGNARRFDEKGLVATCSSFSKTLSPGYRVGWMIPGKFYRKALQFKASTTLTSASPTQMAVAEFLRRGLYERHLKRLRPAIAHTVRTFQYHVGRHFPEGTRITDPRGGYCLWAALPEHIDSREFFFLARDFGIGMVPGTVFSFTDRFRNYLRLNCRGAWRDELAESVRKLGDLVKEF